ncbi:MAG: YhdP family protein [Gammaproteobacteria bacterium]
MLFRRVLGTVYHVSVYCIGILVLVTAVGATLIRLTLPDIGEYRSEIEDWLGRNGGYPVTIQSMRADWQGWTPRLLLTNIDLLNQAGTHTLTGFDKTYIEIAPIKSLLQWQLIPRRLIISGVQLSVERLADGSIFVAGISIDEQPDVEPLEMSDWLLKQDRIVIQNAQIEWLDAGHNQPPVLLSAVSLELRSDGDRAQGDGYCELPGKYGRSLHFAFDATGDLMSTAWTGDLYMQLDAVKPDNWYRQYQPAGIRTAGGQADMQIWSHWRDARMQSIEGRLSYHDFAAQSAQGDLQVEQLAYSFNGRRDQYRDWQWRLLLDTLVTENGVWPESGFAFAANRPADKDVNQYFAISFDYLKLDDVVPLLDGINFIPGAVKERIVSAGISGELTHGNVVYQQRQRAEDIFSYDLTVARLNTDSVAELPGVSAFSGRLSGSARHLHAGFRRDNVQFVLPGELPGTSPLLQLDGDIHAQWRDGQWSFFTDALTLGTGGHKLKLQGNYNNHDVDYGPQLNLFAELTTDKLDKLYELIPATDDFQLKQWMQRTIQGGYLDSARFVLRGKPGDFPFRHNEGRFQGRFNVTDMLFEYSPKWPPMSELDAEVAIDNVAMIATAVDGRMFDAQIHPGGNMRVADMTLRPKQFELTGKVTGQTDDLNNFINGSPLTAHKILGPLTNNLSAGGILLDLDMFMAIRSPTIKPRITGNIDFSDATLSTPDKKIHIEKINGPLGFTRTSVNADGLSAEMDQHPVRLSIKGPGNGPDELAALTITGRADQDFLTGQLAERVPQLQHFSGVLNRYMQGDIEWQAVINYVREADEIRQYLTLSSDLHGMAINLPAPVGKPTWDRTSLSIRKQLGGAPQTSLRYNDAILALFKQAADTKKLQQLQIALGTNRVPDIDPALRGLFIGGATDQLSFRQWSDTLKGFAKPAGNGATGFVSGNDIHVDLAVGDLDFYRQHFSDIHITAARSQGSWRVQPVAPGISGSITTPAHFADDYVITAELDRLTLDKRDGDNGEVGAALDPLAFPALDINVKNFVFRDMQLGSLRLLTTRIGNGLSVEDIRLHKDDMEINGRGVWSSSPATQETSFSAELRANKMRTMLETFGYYGSSIKKGKTTMEWDTTWPGSPMDFSLDEMRGNLNIEVEKGRILEVDPAAGRLFGLLSLQTLPRRLSLDFTDLLAKGLAFDKIEGNFEFSRGDAYTNNLQLVGPTANVNISGRTGLMQQDYDQIATVTPQVADNLPVASALFGPVGIGVGAMLYLASNMFSSLNNSIDNILRYQYAITGPWQNPTIEKLKPHTSQAEEKLSQFPDPANLQNK